VITHQVINARHVVQVDVGLANPDKGCHRRPPLCHITRWLR
jgi:hypothetical protein